MAENNGEMTVIGSDSHFKGELQFQKTARIHGRFDGEIKGDGELQVAQSAQCEASVEAGTTVIDGRVQGNVTAKETVRLNGSGVVRGDITAAKMVMAEGASFYGQCAVGPDAGEQAGRSGGSPRGGSSGGSGGGGSTPPSGDQSAQSQPPKK
jgi:cytoskeletal protein CcmA (bactofilin family)